MCKQTEDEGQGLSDEGLARWRKGFVCLTQLVWASMPVEQRREERNAIIFFCESVATLVKTEQVPVAGALIRRVASLFGSPVVYIPGLLPKEHMDSAWAGAPCTADPTQQVISHLVPASQAPHAVPGPWDLVAAVLQGSDLKSDPKEAAAELRMNFRNQPCMEDWAILWPEPSQADQECVLSSGQGKTCPLCSIDLD